MKSLLVALGGLGLIAVIYSLLTKAQTATQKALQTKGVTPNPSYNPIANIWSERQPSNTNPPSPASPIIGVQNQVPTVVPNDPTALDIIHTAILLGVGSGGRPSATATTANDCGTVAPVIGACPSGPVNPGLSQTFWAADKVPINVNMPGSDADPNLAINWSVV